MRGWPAALLILGLAVGPDQVQAIGDTTVTATGGIAIGGDVSNSQIGIPPDQLAGIIAAATAAATDPLKKLTDEQRAQIDGLTHRLGTNEAQL